MDGLPVVRAGHGLKGRGPTVLRVLTYHRIGDPTDTPDLDPLLVSATPEAFGLQMAHLRRWYHPVGIEEIIEAFETGRRLPSRSVHVTVDDAYRDFRDVAWPILRREGIPVTVFVPTAYPGALDRSFWWDRLHRESVGRDGWSERLRQVVRARALSVPGRDDHMDVRAILRRLPHGTADSVMDQAYEEVVSNGGGRTVETLAPAVLGWDDLRELQREGVSFGAHTRHHVALPCVDLASIRVEIRRSLADLTRELGPSRWPIAYPYGMCNATVARIAHEEGCILGFTGEDGLNRPGTTDPLRMRRSNITMRTTPSVFAVRMLPWCANIDRWRRRRQHVLSAS
jgi:peptidoglycan/xylan/chitin deacetylase (PgdA/CDA1 family)